MLEKMDIRRFMKR